MTCTVRSVRPTTAAMSRILAVGLRAISTSTCPCPVSRVQLPALWSRAVITTEYILARPSTRNPLHVVLLVRAISRNLFHVSIDMLSAPARSWKCPDEHRRPPMDDLTPSPRPADKAATDAELVGLVQSLPAGSTPRERAFETLIARYRPMVRSCVHRYQTPPELADELMQAGYLGLMKAITNFDPDVGAGLPAYAQPCISGEIKRYFRDHRSQIRIQRPLQE